MSSRLLRGLPPFKVGLLLCLEQTPPGPYLEHDYFILFYFILFYFILFYFISFYFIFFGCGAATNRGSWPPYS
jgi:hypothetical protein